MKKYILSFPFLLVLLLLQNAVPAQPLVKKTLTASEKTKLASLQKAPETHFFQPNDLYKPIHERNI